jgi:hypothetical protein
MCVQPNGAGGADFERLRMKHPDLDLIAALAPLGVRAAYRYSRPTYLENLFSPPARYGLDFVRGSKLAL